MHLRYISIILVLLSSSVVVLAEDESTQTDNKENEKTKTTKPGIGKRAQVKTLEEFIPSEEVSADKAVAFPNDI